MSFYSKIERLEFQWIDEVGAKPFLLFKYYQTYSTAQKICPSLETTARDLGMVDKQGKPAKSAVSNLNKILIEKKWIEIKEGQIFILKSFRISERPKQNKVKKHSEKMNESFRKSEHNHSENLNTLSENLNKHSEILNESFRKSERPYKEEKEQKERTERTEEKDTLAPARESFTETENLVSSETRIEVENSLTWILGKKGISKRNLPVSEWLALFADLEAEKITQDGFKEFYLWCEGQDWIIRKQIPITPNLMRGQIEAFKNREAFQAKAKGVTNASQLTRNGVKTNESATTINGANQRANAIIADRQRFESPTFN